MPGEMFYWKKFDANIQLALYLVSDFLLYKILGDSLCLQQKIGFLREMR